MSPVRDDENPMYNIEQTLKELMNAAFAHMTCGSAFTIRPSDNLFVNQAYSVTAQKARRFLSLTG